MAAWMDHLVDVLARRPSGSVGRFLYKRPAGHLAGFHRVLERVPIGERDHVLEVGCGAGVFLEMALASGCRACALDHSPDMVHLAREQNQQAVDAGRLDIRDGDAASLPFETACFSRVFCLNAFFFFPQPQAALAEMARVLAPDGTLVILTASPKSEWWMRWAFGPIATRMRFDAPETLSAWSEACGLQPVGSEDVSGDGLLFLARKPLPIQADTVPSDQEKTELSAQ